MIESFGGIVQEAIQILRQKAASECEIVKSTADVDELRVKYLGRKGPIQELMQGLRNVSKEERPKMGKYINDLKQEISERLESLHDTLIEDEEEQRIKEEGLDVSEPGRRRYLGRKHLLTHALDEMIDILISMGFSVQHGPHIEQDYYNFEVLNMDEDHPARDMQDTFYITPEYLLRTHTSNIQARVMEKNQPPIRIIAPGRAYRNEAISARSHVFFHQIEGLYVDKNVTFADLLSTIDDFFQKLFKKKVKMRYRPSYFPFVEPGMEVDVECLICGGKGCTICKHTGWLEVAGAGMVHPEVLKNCGIDPEEYTGYAWGMGLERLVIIMNRITDIRIFTENDIRFLSQFH
jgi:phenylalanyl-tRNA synthetase alpha chain